MAGHPDLPRLEGVRRASCIVKGMAFRTDDALWVPGTETLNVVQPNGTVIICHQWALFYRKLVSGSSKRQPSQELFHVTVPTLFTPNFNVVA